MLRFKKRLCYNKFTMRVIDQTKIYQNYKGQWVILNSRRTKVLLADKNLDKAVSKYHQRFGKKEIPLTFKVPTRIIQ